MDLFDAAMRGTEIPDELRRFLLTGSLSVPHVEAILQLRGSTQALDAQGLAMRLYVRAGTAASVLADLCEIGIAHLSNSQASTYNYLPRTPELAALVDKLEYAYARHLVEVTRLIHSAEDNKALEFADAFRFRKEP